MVDKHGRVMTTLRIPKELHSKLELVRSATQYRAGSRVTLNDLMVLLLDAQISDIEEHNPGAFERGGLDLDFIFSKR